MKIILIQTPINNNYQPHLGLAYLISILKKNNHDVTQMDISLELANSQSYGKLNHIQKKGMPFILSDDKKFLDKIFTSYINRILNENPDIVGFSISSFTIFYSLYLAKKIKKINPKIKILFGGQGLMFLKKNITKLDVVDYIIKGEGEFALIKLLNQIGKGTKNLSIKKEINDINKIPFPEFKESDIKKSRYPHILPMILSRGCNGNCTFCNEKFFWGKYRIRDIDNIIEEFKTQKSKYDINNFWLCDSLINGNMDFFSDFCDRLIKENLKIYWGGNLKIHSKLTKKFCKKMYIAGCRFLRIGIESGSQDVLNHMRKGIEINNSEEAIKNIYNANIYTHVYIIVGYPTEQNEDFLKTFNFLLKNNNFINSFYVHEFSHPRILLKNNNSLFEIQENKAYVKKLRYDILKLFINSFTDVKFYQEFLNIKDLSNYKNKRIDRRIFTRPLIVNNKYYGNNEEIELNKNNNVKLSNIKNLNLNDKKIFISIDNNFDKITKIPQENKIMFTRPIPKCLKISKNNPQSCKECMEFLKIRDNSLFVCKKYFKILDKEENINNHCIKCIYLIKKECCPCHYLKDDNSFIKA